MKKRSDKYSRKIRIAIVITVLLIVPSALGLGIYLKNKLPGETQKPTTTEIIQ